MLTINGKSRHVLGYLQDFLFAPDRARGLVKFLSGGERNRLLLARLLARPANVLVLDEPTNDLDAETLELLEERLVEFPGTVLLVSHDREFLNNVVTSTIVFEPGGVREYVGGYDDWLRQRASPRPSSTAPGAAPTPASPADASPSSASGRRRLTYAEKRELQSLPALIEQLENRIAEMQERMGRSEFYQLPPSEIAQEQAQWKKLGEQLEQAYARWEQLDEGGG
jgi:ABC transport system ATP-binding/permease protein